MCWHLKAASYLPDKKRFLVNHSGLDDFTPGEYAPRDCINAGTGLVAVVISFAGDCHVGQRWLLAYGRLKYLKLLWRNEKFDICLLVDIPAHDDNTALHRVEMLRRHDRMTIMTKPHAHPSGPPQPTFESVDGAALT